MGISSIDTAPTYLNSASYISQIKDINKFKVCSKLPSVNCRFDKIKDEVNNCVRTILIANSIKKIDTILIHDPLLPLDSKRWNIVNNCLQKFKKKKS